MTSPVTPTPGAYPVPAIVSRQDAVTPPAPRAVTVEAARPHEVRAGAQLPGIALAGPGWVPVLHSAPRRGLRADEAERRRYRASYAGASAAPVTTPARMERRA
jgi:hypothetical protein